MRFPGNTTGTLRPEDIGAVACTLCVECFTTSGRGLDTATDLLSAQMSRDHRTARFDIEVIPWVGPPVVTGRNN